MKKSNKLSDEVSRKLLDEICVWIDKNIETDIGWAALCEASELNHKQLQSLFDKYMQTTPMTYVRMRKEESKKQKPNFTITPNFLSKED